jgi:predicted enzyme related to lactoylglutathione lyase
VEKNSYAAGTPSWVDLGSPDPAGAGAFYSELFGWQIEDLGPDAGGYSMANLRGKPVAGIGPQMNADTAPYWTVYFATADADALAAAVTAAGGQVLAGPMDVFDAGRMVVCADSAGAAFSGWQALNHIGAAFADEAGTTCWHELNSADPARSEVFYGSVFGWKAHEEDVGGSTYHIWRLNDETIGGMMAMDAEMAATVPPSWMPYFAVDDCDTTVALATSKGATVLAPARDIPPGRMAVLADLHGAVFAVLSPNEMSGAGDGAGGAS